MNENPAVYDAGRAVDLAIRLGHAANRLAASLAEFDGDLAASAEWIQALGDAEHALDRALGLNVDQVCEQRCGQPEPCEVRRMWILWGQMHRAAITFRSAYDLYRLEHGEMALPPMLRDVAAAGKVIDEGSAMRGEDGR